jgi:hypothetical protein
MKNILFEKYFSKSFFIKLNNIKMHLAYIGPYRTIVCSDLRILNVEVRAETASPPLGGDGVVYDARIG